MIIIARAGNITLNKPSYNFGVDCSKKELEEWFNSFIYGQQKTMVLTHPIPEKFFELFQSLFITIHAAGGVIFRNNKMLFIFRNEKWDLPKGKIDKGENARQAALREVEEECGISGHKIVKQLPSTFHIYKSPYKKNKGQLIFKETFWFEMKYTGNENGVPQTEEGITKISWFDKNNLDAVWQNTYENLKEIIGIYRP